MNYLFLILAIMTGLPALVLFIYLLSGHSSLEGSVYPYRPGDEDDNP